MTQPLRPAESEVAASDTGRQGKDRKSGSLELFCFLTTHGDTVRPGDEGCRRLCLPHFPTQLDHKSGTSSTCISFLWGLSSSGAKETWSLTSLPFWPPPSQASREIQREPHMVARALDLSPEMRFKPPISHGSDAHCPRGCWENDMRWWMTRGRCGLPLGSHPSCSLWTLVPFSLLPSLLQKGTEDFHPSGNPGSNQTPSGWVGGSSHLPRSPDGGLI